MTITDQVSRAVSTVPTQLMINGSWRDADRDATLPVEDPATGGSIAEVADASDADALAALDAACAEGGSRGIEEDLQVKYLAVKL
jgi:succinate-semialdehyde dehydrogenase / glutarate-semialdehyde dehydrogenase